MLRTSLLSLFLAFITLSAAAQTPPTAQEQVLLQQMRDAAKRQGLTLTPEMEAMALQRMREMQANVLGMQMAVQGMKQLAAESAPHAAETMPAAAVQSAGPAAASAPSAVTASGGDWLVAIARHKAHARQTEFEDAKDGFVANGQPWLDPEGEIQWYGADRATGNVTYLVRQGPQDFVVRFANVNAPDAPVTVGHVTATNNRESFSGVDGTQLSGDDIIVIADGVIATRDSAFFRYEFGSAPTAHAIPDQYHILYAQRGDVVGTGFVLAVKQAHKTFGDRFLQNMSGQSAPKAPTIFGKRDPDFALVDTVSGQLTVIPRSEATTDIGWHTRYKTDGTRNTHHFFNAITWQQTSMGPVAIVFADDDCSIYAIQLKTGQQTTVFHRGLGINDWRATPTAEGGLKVDAQLGFKHESVDDVRSSFSAGQ